MAPIREKLVTDRSGFSAVEILVSIAVVSMLLALLLPAVQSSREVARRAQCLNNMRQMAEATEHYVGVTGYFPGAQRLGLSPIPASGDLVGPAPDESTHSRLLPYLDQQPLYEKLSPVGGGRELSEPLELGNNSFVLGLSIPVFVCPSDRVPAGGVSIRGCMGTSTGLGFSQTRKRPPEGDPFPEGMAGVFQGTYKRNAVVDGASHTALFSERVVGDGDPGTYDPFRDLAFDQGNQHYHLPNDALRGCSAAPWPSRHFSSLGHSWVFDGYGHTRYNHVATPNSRVADCHDAEGGHFSEGMMTARSLHIGGVNLTFVDGSGRFIGDSVDLRIWRAISTINGGEVISEF